MSDEITPEEFAEVIAPEPLEPTEGAEEATEETTEENAEVA